MQTGVTLLWIYGALVAQFWRWLHQNHLGANMKGLVVYREAACFFFPARSFSNKDINYPVHSFPIIVAVGLMSRPAS